MYYLTYGENVAHTHICADRALALEVTVAEKAAGQAYFITNMEPIKFWEFVSLILEGLGYERPRIKIPAAVLMPITYMVAYAYKLLAPYGMKVSQLTSSRIRLISQSRTFNFFFFFFFPSRTKQMINLATHLLCHSRTMPRDSDARKVNPDTWLSKFILSHEGLKRTIESLPHLRAEVRSKKGGRSKASIFLGNGRPADALLWMEQTLKMMLVLVAFYFHFIASGYTIVTAVSKLLLVSTVFLFINGKLPEKMFGYRIKKIPEAKFHISDEMSLQVAQSIALGWNSAINSLKS